MIKIIAVSLLLGVATLANGQFVDTIYYNSDWELTSIGTSQYYRVAEIDTVKLKFVGKVKDYYSGGKLILDGYYNEGGKKHGHFTRYHENGGKYSEGDFNQDTLAGIWSYYDEDGSLFERVNFNNKQFVIEDYYDKEGNHLVKNGTGKWHRVFHDITGYQILTAYFIDNKRVDTWTVKGANGDITIKEEYKDGRLKKGKMPGTSSGTYKTSKFLDNLFYPESFINIDNFKIGTNIKPDYSYIKYLSEDFKHHLPYGHHKDSLGNFIEGDDIYQIVEDPAHYPGGISSFYNYIMKNLRYPADAHRMGVEGRVFVEFVIDVDGSVIDIKILRGIGGGCDEEAVRVIKKSGKWIPGRQRGEPVKMRMVLPITFRLN
ncbi:MAG: TonB family protein [Bacteroidota bacterium]